MEIDLDGGKIVVDNSKTAHVYHYIDKEGNPCTEDYLNEHMNMMEVAMLTSGNGAGSKLYTEETFENNDGWGFQHTTVMQNFAAHILTGSPLLAPGEDGINGVNLANSSQLSHEVKKRITNGKHRVIYHAHTTNTIALTFVLPLDDQVFTRELWESATECPVVFPDGVGVVGWMVPGGRAIAEKTAELMEKYDVAIWAHHGMFCSGEDFDLTFGLMHTVEKSAEILVKILSMTPRKIQTITPENFRDNHKDYKDR